MQLKKSFITGVIALVIALFCWEMYWRSQGYIPDLDDDKDLWAVQRAKVADLGGQDVILTGSSRVLFDVQLDIWEEQEGVRPLQLAGPGSTPLPVVHDIVNNTDFNGTLIVGVAPPFFFSGASPKNFFWKRPQAKIDHFYDRTYAQRLNHQLSIPLQNSFAFIGATEEEFDSSIDLKSLLKRIKVGKRALSPKPPFHQFQYTSLDRNTKLSQRTATDTAFANTVIKVWGFFGKISPPPDKESTMAFFLEDVKKFREKGGTMILVRCPSSGGFRFGENMVVPRKEYWDELVKQSQLASVHFEDYPAISQFNCPEESHLRVEDAEIFTTELIKIINTNTTN